MANFLCSYRGIGLSLVALIAGWDEMGPALYYVDSEGRSLKGMQFYIGSGSPYAKGVLDNGYWYDMTVVEATELVRRAIFHGTFRDAASGGVTSVYLVGPDGWKQLSWDNVGELHCHYYPVMPPANKMNISGAALDDMQVAPSFALSNAYNCNVLQKEVVQMVKPTKGSTTLAFHFKHGVMVATG